MKKLIFQLSEFEYLKVITKNNMDFEKIDYCCSEVQAYFVTGKKIICIGEQTAGNFFESFIKRLDQVVFKKLHLDGSLTKNLGFMYNQYCQKKDDFVMIPTSDNSSMYWIGLKYNMWSTYNTTNPMLTTWLYNDQDDNIIFEIAPLYKWSFFPDEPENLDFVTYEEFMKDYQPIIQRVIGREIAIEWLDQAMKAYRSLFDSEEDFLSACKEFKL